MATDTASLLAGLDPSLPLLQQQAQQAQAYAQMLRQQAMTQQRLPDAVPGGRTPRMSFLQPLVQILMGKMAGDQQRDANTMSETLAQKQGQMMREMIFGQQQAPVAPQPPAAMPDPAGAALTQGAAAGSVGPTTDNAARMAALLKAPPLAPIQPAAAAGAPLAMPGMDPRQAYAAMLMGGPEEYIKALMSRTDNRTDFTKLLVSMGIDPASPQGQAALAGQLQKQNYIAPTSLRQNGYVQYPGEAAPRHLPAMPEGTQGFPQADGTWRAQPVPGALEGVTSLSAAKEAGKAPYTLVEGFDPVRGVPVKNYAGNMLQAPPVPGTQPAAAPAPSAAGVQISSAPGGVRAPMTPNGAVVPSNPAEVAQAEADARAWAESKRPKTPLAAGASPAGIQTGPALGQAATADALGKDSAKAAVQAYTDLHQHATNSAPRAIGLLQSIEQLADQTLAGHGSSSVQLVNGVLQTLGIPIGKDSAQNYQIMEKNLNMLVGAQRMGAGGGGTDALQHLLEAANPNVQKMNAPALKEAAQELIAYQRMLLAKDKAAPNPNTTSPQAYAEFETKFAPYADPRLWQIEHAASDAERARILSLMPAADRAGFLQRAKQARQAGFLN